MLVCQHGEGSRVHLNPEYGEFLLSYPDMQIARDDLPTTVSSILLQSMVARCPAICELASGALGKPPSLSARCIGSLVADFIGNLLRGGIYCYPAESGRVES